VGFLFQSWILCCQNTYITLRSQKAVLGSVNGLHVILLQNVTLKHFSLPLDFNEPHQDQSMSQISVYQSSALVKQYKPTFPFFGGEEGNHYKKYVRMYIHACRCAHVLFLIQKWKWWQLTVTKCKCIFDSCQVLSWGWSTVTGLYSLLIFKNAMKLWSCWNCYEF